MALFRYAKSWVYGLYSSFGMYLGHFFAWICSGVMGAAVGREMHPGLMAFEAAGLGGHSGHLLFHAPSSLLPLAPRVSLGLDRLHPAPLFWKRKGFF